MASTFVSRFVSTSRKGASLGARLGSSSKKLTRITQAASPHLFKIKYVVFVYGIRCQLIFVTMLSPDQVRLQLLIKKSFYSVLLTSKKTKVEPLYNGHLAGKRKRPL